ncbi:MAG: type I-C CRISPR-associated protein Cas8c/Csd1, partial [Devosia sp.]
MSILASLARAYDRLPDAPPYGYSAEKISFVVGLNADGTVASVTDLRSGEGRKKQPRIMQVPQPAKRTVKIIPNLLWDKTSYALGVSAEMDERTSREHAAFVECQIEVFGNSEDPGLRALLAFLREWSPLHFVPPLWPDDMKDQNLVFVLEKDRLQGRFLHDREAARALVGAHLAPDDETFKALCLVTGLDAPVARLHPAIKNVWGAQSSGASIVSFNRDAFESYGHEQGTNAPVSQAAAFKYTTVLNAFLAGRKNRLQIGDASTVFWADASGAETAGEVESVFAAMLGEKLEIDEGVQAEKVGNVLARSRNGEVWSDIARAVDPGLQQGVRFHVLGLAPNAARISIRYWFEDDFGVLAANYQAFLRDVQIGEAAGAKVQNLRALLARTAPARVDRQGRLSFDLDRISPQLTGDLFRAVISGSRLPGGLLPLLLMRIRADHFLDRARVSLVKAAIVRGMRLDDRLPQEDYLVRSDPNDPNPARRLGRLFALIERAQLAALGDKINSTVKDK